MDRKQHNEELFLSLNEVGLLFC